MLSFTYIIYYIAVRENVTTFQPQEKCTQLKKTTGSTPAKKTPPVIPNTNPHDEDTIKSLTTRINLLEKRVLELEGVLEVTRNANSLLEQEVDNLQQYQRSACIIVDGITLVKDETEEQITAKAKHFLTKNLGFEGRKVNEELDKTNVIVLGKQKMENNPQLYDSNLTHFEVPSMQAETTYKTKKNQKSNNH